MIQVKRIYDSVTEDDGYRVLIDRLWPRGFSKEDAKVDLWMKEIAPSTELRKWFHHDPDKWMEFQQRYKDELVNKKELIDQLLKLEKEKKVITLLFSAKDREKNQAMVLIEVLRDKV
ncbi:MAG: DUF488 domain-containing protein [Fermentimonas caenicola]|jgi:uncharacterized protein YeaO (DUF488 family)|uniref:Uroporphyrin-III C-methyltransferase n=1 Tax=Fermentimonas caenicola TaxID=1562970 RepID=A0A098BZD9_9BACT|nr:MULTISPECIES: DUF488 family protein [Lascolabacillus]MBP7105464.1 DUF488 family protein [Fermentimonas sp.]MDI9625009.1 DUF488 family protein [Bacteroidota bacterium]CEA15538.1 hypothetical protein ING2E5B_0772 [Fermentimonas caenicola]MCK9500465.1 DUF488 family protein [Lascolabacillus sp.]MDD2606205.1 DUF488 family protein [Lascolabacillus sp.]